MTEHYTIEFNDLARHAISDMGLDSNEERKYINRLSKDNVAQIVVLEVIPKHGVSGNYRIVSYRIVACVYLYVYLYVHIHGLCLDCVVCSFLSCHVIVSISISPQHYHVHYH